MKKAISISIGSSKRDKTVEISLFGEQVQIERRGTDGDMERAAQLYGELDGKVDAFGVGGADLGLMVDGHWYRLHSVKSLVRHVRKTPVVDGTGLKTTLERKAGEVVERELGKLIPEKKVLVMPAVDRWGLSHSFVQAGFTCIFGDMLFSLGLPFPLHTERSVKIMARLLIPIVGRLPFKWVYPIGKEQEKRKPKYTQYFQWASVVAGDCHYIRRYMPERMDGKVIVTNTTTPEDKEIFKQAGVKYLMTTTPVLDGRSFGTNMMESAIVAALGRKEPVDYTRPGNYFEIMADAVNRLEFRPQIQEL
jgi:hypothetical protein